jgi:RNA polymerase sigma-70 factor (ECF subfamily)
MKKPDEPSSAPREPWEADAKLARAAARSDRDAQHELLRSALPVVRQTARQLLGPSQDADDAIQATLLEVLRSAARFEGRSSLKTWVTRISIRTMLRLAEKQRTLVPVDMPEPEPSPTPESGAGEALPARLSDYLDQVPLQQRVALVLRHGFDYTVDEIADATATSRNTVKYRLKEALSTIRRLVRRDLAMRGKRHDG